MHVLLVEDSAINRRFIGLALSKSGFQLTSVENGQLAVEQAQAGQYDAILMDMQMPVMDGFQATTRLRQLGLTTPIIALTGHATEADRERCTQAGCSHHLAKPVQTARLLDTLNAIIAVAPPPDLASDSADFSDELRRIALDYLDVQRQRINDMEESLQNVDFEQLAELAHRMKGTAGTVGFPKFTHPAERLEAAAISNDRQACSAIIREIATQQAEAETQVSSP